LPYKLDGMCEIWAYIVECSNIKHDLSDIFLQVEQLYSLRFIRSVDNLFPVHLHDIAYTDV